MLLLAGDEHRSKKGAGKEIYATWASLDSWSRPGANGLWILIRPLDWYYTMPGVTGTGPPNLHFMRNIGCAYVVVCASLFWTAKEPRQGWPSVFTSGLFLALHALVHLWDTLAGRQSAHQLVTDLPGVVLPALLVLWVAWLAQRSSAKE